VHDSPFDAAANASMPTASYDLPDGTTLELGPDRLNIPECLFQPKLLAGYGLGSIADRSDCVSLPDAVMKTLAATDSDLRRDLLGAVVLSGGGALLTGLRDRLEREVGEAARSLTPRVKVVCPANTIERRFGVWIGGSILASLGSFQQMWMSKAEYEEHGKSLIHRRAP
jgi:actin-like protein 6A